MIGKNTLKKYGYNHILDYFRYIISSVENGQRTQARELYKRLSQEQKYNFIIYCSNNKQNESLAILWGLK